MNQIIDPRNNVKKCFVHFKYFIRNKKQNKATCLNIKYTEDEMQRDSKKAVQ